MNPIPFLSPAVIALAVGVSSTASVPAQEAPPTVASITNALGLTVAGTTPLTIAHRDASAVAAACGIEPAVVANARIWSARIVDAGPLLVACTKIDQGDRPAWAAVALSPERAFVAATVVDGAGSVIAEWRHFTERLQASPVPRLAGAKPRSHLRDLRKLAAAKHGDADSSLLVALLDLQQSMNEQAALLNLPEDAERDRIAEARAAHRALLAAKQQTTALAALLGPSRSEFESLAQKAAEAADEMADALASGDRQAALRHQRTMLGTCKQCHRLPSADDAELKLAAAARRSGLGIGDGFYQIGHDVRLFHPDRARTQRVADALRIAVLCIDASLGNGDRAPK